MSLNEKLLIALIALNVLNAFLTVRILKDGCKELNPVMDKLMKKIGVVPALVLAKAAGIGVLACLLPTIPYQAMLALCGFYIGVVLWNVKTLKELN
jgi:hypothetical protein